jgi:hypothetical protein
MPARKPILITHAQEQAIYIALDYTQQRMTGLDIKQRARLRSLRNRFLGGFPNAPTEPENGYFKIKKQCCDRPRGFVGGVCDYCGGTVQPYN